MVSNILRVIAFFCICLTASSQLAPVYNPGGSQVSVKPVIPRVQKSRAINVARPRRNQLITETVYGFLDFTTTVGNTVMVFTPQSEEEKLPTPISSSVSVISATSVSPKVETTRPPRAPQNIERIEKTTSAQTTKAPATAAPSGLARLLQEALSLRGGNSKSFTSRPHRNTPKKSGPTGHRNRGFRPTNRRKNTPNGGTTLVPIVVEGKGGVLPPRTPILEPSIYVPEEVVVSISQKFPPLSAVGPFNNEVRNDIKSTDQYNIFATGPTPSLSQPFTLVNQKSNKPTGLVTTLGGTVISNGQTTIHKTSVIGTYVSGKYAQVLKSTSKIFKENPSENLITPTRNKYETVKEVIKGTATQFFKPEATASLPIESLFSSARRVPRYEALSSSNSRLTKRRGTNPYPRDDYYYYDNKDQYYYDEYEDLERAGSGVRQSYRPAVETPKIIATSTNSFRRAESSTYRPRFKPTGTRNIPPSFLRNSPPPEKHRNTNRFKLSRPNLKVRRPTSSPKSVVNIREPEKEIQYPSSVNSKGTLEETVRVVTSKPADGSTDIWYEIATLRSLHTFRVGTAKNTRYATYTKTFTHTIKPTSALELASTEKTVIADKEPLFENILDDKQAEIATLPPINIDGRDLNSLLRTTTETFKTIETMYKTSVLPVKYNNAVDHHTLIQTYLITRIVSAVKTIPPVDAFEFVPSDSLNEFNTKLLAEGTENEAALLPGEREYDENSETRVPPPPGFKSGDSDLADLAGGKFNPEALEKQLNPKLAAAIKTHKNGEAPELTGTKQVLPTDTATATPTLSPEALQLAYLRLMNPFMFGGFPGAQTQHTTVTSSPVVITTDVTTTSTRVLKVIFNARPILTTISSTEVVRTTITSYSTATVTAQPKIPGLSFPFPSPINPFVAGG